MNGAESLVRSLLASGVDTCFANPGTSEMHFVAALDKVAGMRCVLGLAETSGDRMRRWLRAHDGKAGREAAPAAHSSDSDQSFQSDSDHQFHGFRSPVGAKRRGCPIMG